MGNALQSRSLSRRRNRGGGRAAARRAFTPAGRDSRRPVPPAGPPVPRGTVGSLAAPLGAACRMADGGIRRARIREAASRCCCLLVHQVAVEGPPLGPLASVWAVIG